MRKAVCPGILSARASGGGSGDGNAAGALCALLAQTNNLPRSFTINQGIEIGRPSEIEVEIGVDERPTITGRCIPVCKGELMIP